MATFQIHGPVKCQDFEQLTVDATAGGVGLTAAKYSRLDAVAGEGVTRSRWAFITTETADVRYTFGDTAPTDLIGHLLPAGSQLLLEGPEQISQVRFIRTGSTSATFQVSYF